MSAWPPTATRSPRLCWRRSGATDCRWKRSENYLDARIFDLYDDPMPSRNDLEGYCGETASALIQLASLILDASAAPRFADVAGHAGCAQAIAGLLRLLPIHRARGQCYVPKDILAAAGTSPEEFVAGDGGAGARRAVSAMVALARQHLSAFEAGAKNLPRYTSARFAAARAHRRLSRPDRKKPGCGFAAGGRSACLAPALAVAAPGIAWVAIEHDPESGNRFSGKIMLKQRTEAGGRFEEKPSCSSHPLT